MSVSNKVHLVVKPSLNGWYQFRKGKYNVQLAGHSEKGGLWLTQYAKKLGKNNFMKDFTEILEAIHQDNIIIEQKYGHLSKGDPNKQYPVAIFSLYISE